MHKPHPIHGLSRALLLGTAILFGAQGLVSAAEITVFAAASLADSLTEIASAYDRSSQDQVVLNFAASGTLALQIEAGATADIFFSADEAKAAELAEKGLLVSGSRKDLLGNSLAIVTAPEGTLVHAPDDLTNAAVKRIALGDPKIVPAGAYAKEYLVKAGLWRAVEPKVIPCENVRAVLAAAESGNVDAGIVYMTDAAISKKVRVAFDVPSASAPKITYPVALLKDSPHPDAAGKFLTYLESPEAGAVFRRHGFIFLPSDGKTF